MSPEKINTIINRFCGWKESLTQTDECNFATLSEGEESIVRWTYVNWESKNYYNDLNAIAEAEKLIPDNLQMRYAEFIFEGVGGFTDYYEGIVFYEAMKMIFASAPQRAVALVKTIGEWDES